MTADHVDEPVIPAPDVQDDPMEAPAAVEDILADTGAEVAKDEHEGFLGGPSDPSVLTQYVDHVACSVWTGKVFILFIFSYFFFQFLVCK